MMRVNLDLAEELLKRAGINRDPAGVTYRQEYELARELLEMYRPADALRIFLREIQIDERRSRV